jgi:hypothetical protein
MKMGRVEMMDQVLSEFYHGAIHPEEEYQPRDEEYRQIQKRIEEKKTALLARVEKDHPEFREEMECLLEEICALEAMDMEKSYIRGMRMGARLALGLLGREQE